MRRRTRLFLKGKRALDRRRLAAVFFLIFAPAAAPRAARAACVEVASREPLHAGASDVVASATADLDRDGDLDVVTVFGSLGTVVWFDNDGDLASWSPHTIGTTESLTYALAAADLDGDGDADVAAASYFGGLVGWFENDGSPLGADWTERTIATAASGLAAVVAADVDGDGDFDLAVAGGAPNQLFYLENDGSPADGGAWTRRTVETSAGDVLNALVAADLDRDGDLDFASAAPAGDRIAWHENDGSPGNGAWPTHTVASGGAPSSVAAADLDGDGDLDLAATALFDGTILWHENDGSPASGAWTPHTVATNLAGAGWVDSVDFDRDGDGDLLTAAAFAFEKVAWWENRDGAGASWTPHFVAGGTQTPARVGSADLDGDGDPDFVLPFPDVDTLRWMRNDLLPSAPLFAPSASVASGLSLARSVAAADIDRDGDLDLLTSASTDDLVSWHSNQGTDDPFLRVTISTALATAYDALVADVDGDGDLDAVGAGFADSTIAWFENDGTPLGAGWTLRTISTAATNPRSLFTADLDRDGDFDLVSASSGDTTVAWYESSGAGTVWTAFEIATALAGAWAVAAADLDRDGDPDVVAGGIDEVVWYANDGTPENAAWSAATIVSSVAGVRSVATGDFDRDGDADVAFADAGVDLLTWRDNDGAGGGWTLHTVSATEDDLRSVEAVDADGDGDLDLVTAALTTDTVAWFENDGAGGGWTRHVVSTASDGPQSATAADLDGDGDLDVASAAAVGGTIDWTENLGTKLHDDGFDSDGDLACWSASVP
jgi:hypothetical protein